MWEDETLWRGVADEANGLEAIRAGIAPAAAICTRCLRRAGQPGLRLPLGAYLCSPREVHKPEGRCRGRPSADGRKDRLARCRYGGQLELEIGAGMAAGRVRLSDQGCRAFWRRRSNGSAPRASSRRRSTRHWSDGRSSLWRKPLPTARHARRIQADRCRCPGHDKTIFGERSGRPRRSHARLLRPVRHRAVCVPAGAMARPQVRQLASGRRGRGRSSRPS